jgi:hypothetical protein
MPMQLTGRVVQVGTPAIGPTLRSWQAAMVWGIVMLILLPVVLVAAAVVKFSMSLVGGFLGSKPQRERGFFMEYLNDTLAHLTAERLGKSGQTLICNARIRDASGQTVPVRFEGHPVSGVVSVGDDVTVLLRVVRGVYVVIGGQNLSTGESIRLRR